MKLILLAIYLLLQSAMLESGMISFGHNGFTMMLAWLIIGIGFAVSDKN